MKTFFKTDELFSNCYMHKDGYILDSNDSFSECKQRVLSKVYSIMAVYTNDPIFNDYFKFKIEFKEDHNEFIGYITYNGKLMFYAVASVIDIMDYEPGVKIDINYRNYFIRIGNKISIEHGIDKDKVIIYEEESYDNKTIDNGIKTKSTISRLTSIVDDYHTSHFLPEKVDMNHFNHEYPYNS